MQPDTFTVLLDAPSKPVSRIQIAKLGSYNDPRYGDFDITRENVANWQKHLTKLPGGEALIDFEHRSERKPRDSVAAGWISGIDIDGDRVMADARWTPKGQDAISNEEYRFLSPVFGPTQIEGETIDDALPSVALTNKPYLASMPAVMLASDERVSEAIDEDPALRFHVRALDGEYGEATQAMVMLDVSQAERDKAHAAGHSLPDKSYPINNAKQLHSAAVLAASGHGDAAAAKTLIRRRAKELGVDVTTLPGFSGTAKQMDADAADSRPPMSEALLKTLGLAEDADEQKMLDAVSELQSKAATADKLERKLAKNPVKTLEAQAQEAGLVLLDADTVKQMQANALAGAEARKQLHEERFENAFTAALNDPRGPRVKPAEKDRLQHFYELDADGTLAMIDEREPLVPAQPRGAAALQLDTDEPIDHQRVAQAGIDPNSLELERKIRKHMLDHNLPKSTEAYMKVLDQWASGTLEL